MNYFKHPYPRYGLAVVLAYNDIMVGRDKELPDEEELAKLAADYISFAMHKYRLHTQDKPKEETNCTLKYRYLSLKI